MIKKLKFPEYSFFGFKILNSFHSILSAYILLCAQFLLTPHFGFDSIQYLAGLSFVFLINIAIIILIINALVRIDKINIIFIILDIPLLLYLPFSINKLYLVISSLRYVYS